MIIMTNFYGIDLYYSPKELEQIEARRTKIEMLKRELGAKYILSSSHVDYQWMTYE
jgi:hypothetical protein